MRKRHLFFLFTAMAIAVLGFAACGGGSSSEGGGEGASTLTITTETSSGSGGGVGMTSFTEGPINNYGYYDPSFSGDCDPDAGALITMCSGVTESLPCDVLVNIRTSGMTPGSYTIMGGTSTSTYFMYMNQGQYYDSVVSQGTITLTSVGNVGQPIEGQFDAVLGLRTNPTTTMTVSGTFSVIRDH